MLLDCIEGTATYAFPVVFGVLCSGVELGSGTICDVQTSCVHFLNDRRNHVCRRINHVPPVIGLGSAATWYIMVSRVQFTTPLQTLKCKTVAMQDL